MRTVIVYESMYGNTHAVAERVQDVASAHGEAVLVPVGDASGAVLNGADLVVVGGPTHAHGMSWTNTRQAAVAAAAKDDDLDLDPDAEGPGLRTWFHGLGSFRGTPGVAFDTRIDAKPALTGRASRGIARRLRHHDFRQVVDPASFLVDTDNHLIEGEAERATRWAESLFERVDQPGGATAPGAPAPHDTTTGGPR